QFPIKEAPFKGRTMFNKLSSDIKDVSDNYSDGKFWNTGVMRHGYYYSADTVPLGDEKPITLREIIVPEEEVPEKYYIEGDKLEKIKKIRSAKKNKKKYTARQQEI